MGSGEGTVRRRECEGRQQVGRARDAQTLRLQFYFLMKICLVGIPGIKPGKHNLKDPRLDQADKLVEASKKTYAQAEVVGEDDALDADAFLVTPDTRLDLI